MILKVIQPHITAAGPVQPGAILDLPDAHAADYISAHLAVPHTEEPQVPVVAKPVEQATNRRRNRETR